MQLYAMQVDVLASFIKRLQENGPHGTWPQNLCHELIERKHGELEDLKHRMRATEAETVELVTRLFTDTEVKAHALPTHF